MRLCRAAMIAILGAALSVPAVAATTMPGDPRYPAYVNQAPKPCPAKKAKEKRHRHKKHAPAQRAGFFSWWT